MIRNELTLEVVNPITADLPPEVVAEFGSFASRVVASSGIAWGEHCSECSAPKCYSTCLFYSPTPDLTCRRFLHGFEPVLSQSDLALHRIRFRKWGKLEGQGPTVLKTNRTLERLRFLEGVAVNAIRSVPFPFRLKRHLVWRLNEFRIRVGGHQIDHGDCEFVIESFACDGLIHPFTVTFLELGGKRLFQARFDIFPKYSKFSIPASEIDKQVNLQASYLVQIEPTNFENGCDVIFGCCDFVRQAPSRRPESIISVDEVRSTSNPVKVIVWDLDNTLWDGTLGEDGIEGVQLRQGVVSAIMELDRRGILHSIASKNDEGIALKALQHFGMMDYFLYPQIGWGPKSHSINAIAKALNLGIESFAFVDDQEFEREEVRSRHARITVIDENNITSILTDLRFNPQVTPESRSRRKMYQEEAARVTLYETSLLDYVDFLRSCRIKLTVMPLVEALVPRVAELSQRTNQLNFRGSKFNTSSVKNLLNRGETNLSYVLKCSDKFGDYGIVGFCILNLKSATVLDFFMSCRIQRKMVENSFFSMVSQRLIAEGLSEMFVLFVPTERNSASKRLLTELGFSPFSSEGNLERWRRALAVPLQDCDVVGVEQLTISETSAELATATEIRS